MKHLKTVLLTPLILGSVATFTSASNLVPNGSFEAGLTGFTSDYALADGGPSSLVPESTYLVGTDASLYHPVFSSFGDHTSGSGKMLIANGSADITKKVWAADAAIPVAPDTLYYFEAWMSSVYPASPAALSFKLEGDFSDATLGTGVAPTTTGVWVPISFTWYSGPNTSVSLFLENANPEPFGNDFAVDDIYFGETSSIVPDGPPGLAWSALGFAVLVFGRQRLRPCQQ